MILFINACVRKDSRTKKLADAVLTGWSGPIVELRLDTIDFPIVDEDFLIRRDQKVLAGDYSSPMFDLARQFAEAEEIVIAAPYWDLSFPAMLKQYFEQINVVGLTFFYTDSDLPETLCRAKKLIYVATAGGPVRSHAYGFGYVKALGKEFYGIDDAALFSAEGIDIVGADAEAILRETEAEIDRAFH